MAANNELGRGAIKGNERSQVKTLQETLAADKRKLAYASGFASLRQESSERFKAEAEIRFGQHKKALIARKLINEKRLEKKVFQLSRDILKDKTELKERKRALDIKRDQARLLSEATRTRDLAKIDARLRMVRAQNYLEDRELKPLVARACNVMDELFLSALDSINAALAVEQFEKANDMFKQCTSLGAQEWIGEKVKQIISDTMKKLKNHDAGRLKLFEMRVYNSIKRHDLEQIKSTLHDIKIANQYTSEELRQAIADAQNEIQKIEYEALNALKKVLNIPGEVNVRGFGTLMRLPTYQVSKLTYNACSDVYRYSVNDSEETCVSGFLSGVDPLSEIRNMQLVDDGKMKFVSRKKGGVGGCVAWRFETMDGASINTLKIMTLSSGTQGSTIKWKILGGNSNEGPAGNNIPADLLGSPSIVDFSQTVEGWNWFQLMANVDPSDQADLDDPANAQLFRVRKDDLKSSQLSIWLGIGLRNLEQGSVNKETVVKGIQRCEKVLGLSKCDRHRLIAYARECVETTE